MTAALIWQVGLPLVGILVGWIGKKWHIQSYVDALETKLQILGQALPSDAKTPVDRPK